jgi:hypothetical protein
VIADGTRARDAVKALMARPAGDELAQLRYR